MAKDAFQQQLEAFMSRDIGNYHASHIRSTIGNYIPAMRRYPHITAQYIVNFARYFRNMPLDNLPDAAAALLEIARHVDGIRDQIIKDLGTDLYEARLLYGDQIAHLRELIALLELPLTHPDEVLRDVVRSLVILKNHAVVIIGAGFSYDAMPTTAELAPLIVPILRTERISDPAQFLRDHDERSWEIVQRRSEDFKKMFIGWSAHSSPSPQHKTLCEMFQAGHLAQVVSFNWDNLCERAHVDLFGREIHKINQDGTVSGDPALWKLHGDVDTPGDVWIFPYQRGRVFRSLLESLHQATINRRVTHCLIVGYSEWEQEVREQLVRWVEANVPTVIRVRPSWPPGKPGGFADTAKRFFQRLEVYMGLAQRGRL